MTLLSINFELA